MAAMAFGLGIRLGKPGVYVLNDPGHAPTTADTQQAIFYASKVALAHIPIALLALFLIAYFKP
jgi:adenosylcobinamide-phosphate synthase